MMSHLEGSLKMKQIRNRNIVAARAVMKRRAGCAVYLVMAAFATAGASATAAAASLSPDSESDTAERNQEIIVHDVGPALQAAHKAARINYAVPCNPNSRNPLPFPKLKTEPRPENKNGLEAVRDIFRNDKRVAVSEQPRGIIQISVGSIPTEVLQTKVRSLTFKADEQFTPALAVAALKNANEVEAVIRRVGLQEALSVDSIAVEHPRRGRPHLPAVMRNVTVDQALNAIAKTFGVVIVFAQCTSRNGPALFDIYVIFL
jgi:hypothetical protein